MADFLLDVPEKTFHQLQTGAKTRGIAVEDYAREVLEAEVARQTEETTKVADSA